MRIHLLISLFLFFFSSSPHRVSSQPEHATFPPRGWNSYDSFDWILSEVDYLQSAEMISQRLQPYGYEYAVVDYLWYRKNVPGAYPDSLGFDVIDEWGRLIPDPDRWPSSEDGKGFTEVAQKVQSVGLKFGIHVMRGLSRQAYDANTPILDTTTQEKCFFSFSFHAQILQSYKHYHRENRLVREVLMKSLDDNGEQKT